MTSTTLGDEFRDLSVTDKGGLRQLKEDPLQGREKGLQFKQILSQVWYKQFCYRSAYKLINTGPFNVTRLLDYFQYWDNCEKENLPQNKKKLLKLEQNFPEQ